MVLYIRRIPIHRKEYSCLVVISEKTFFDIDLIPEGNLTCNCCADCDPGDKFGCESGLMCGKDNCARFHEISSSTGFSTTSDCCQGKANLWGLEVDFRFQRYRGLTGVFLVVDRVPVRKCQYSSFTRHTHLASTNLVMGAGRCT